MNEPIVIDFDKFGDVEFWCCADCLVLKPVIEAEIGEVFIPERHTYFICGVNGKKVSSIYKTKPVWCPFFKNGGKVTIKFPKFNKEKYPFKD